MARHLIRLLLPAAGLAAAAGPAAAQYPYPYPPAAYGSPATGGSPLSPYLNLRNGPNSLPAVNYYNFVRPQLQMQQQQSIAASGAPVLALEPYPLASDIRLDPTGPLPRSSGLPTTFMNVGGYFNSQGTIGVSAYRGGTAGAGGRAPLPTVPSVPRR